MIRTIFTTTIALIGAFALMSFNHRPFPKPKPNPPYRYVDSITRASSESVIGTFIMDERGNLTGSFTSTYKGLARQRERNRYTQNNGKAAYVSSMLPFDNVKIDSFGLLNLEAPEQPLSRLVYCRIPLEMGKINDLRHFLTPLQTDFLCNPLAIPSGRGGKYDLAYEVKNQYTLTVVVPEDFVVEAVPDKQIVTMSGSNSNVEFVTTVKNNVINIDFKMTLVPGTYKSKDFNQFRTLVESVLAKKYEMIVMRKKAGWGGLPEFEAF
jgi:hypothetical protein